MTRTTGNGGVGGAAYLDPFKPPLQSETLCDFAEADRKPGMKLESSQSNRSLATGRKEEGLSGVEGKKKRAEEEAETDVELEK